MIPQGVEFLLLRPEPKMKKEPHQVMYFQWLKMFWLGLLIRHCLIMRCLAKLVGI